MIIAQFTTRDPQMGDTRTREQFAKFVGDKPTRLGIMAKMYTDLSASYLTESLKNIVYRDSKSKDKYNNINTLFYEWELETNEIKKIEFAEVPTGTGAGGTDIQMVFTERYFEKYDIFRIDKSRQQCIVVTRPVRTSDENWSVTVRLIDNNYQSLLDVDACQIGDVCTFQSVAMPELSEEGYSKYQSNIERHRGVITTHRVDISYSALFAAQEDVYLNIVNDNKVERTLLLDKKEKQLLDNFMFVKNQGLLFNKTNVDANGKTTIVDPDTQRPIYIADGIIPQIERYVNKYGYNKLTTNVLQSVISTMVEKADSPVGNLFMFICNEKFWADNQNNLGEFLFQQKTNGTYMFSKASNGDIDVGATFNTYEWAGNQISFKVDRAFTREYGTEKGYAICINVSPDEVEGRPAIELFTLKGGDFISNKVLGVGGESGLDSGVVSSAVTASKLINWGYSSSAVYNPYKGYIIYEV